MTAPTNAPRLEILAAPQTLAALKENLAGIFGDRVTIAGFELCLDGSTQPGLIRLKGNGYVLSKEGEAIVSRAMIDGPESVDAVFLSGLEVIKSGFDTIAHAQDHFARMFGPSSTRLTPEHDALYSWGVDNDQLDPVCLAYIHGDRVALTVVGKKALSTGRLPFADGSEVIYLDTNQLASAALA